MNNLSSSLSRRAMLNVPSPNPERSAYSRFIPREELGDVASWTPGSIGVAQRAAAARAEQPAQAPAGPTPEQWQAQVEAAQQAGYEQGYRDGMAALEGFKKSHAQGVDAQVGQVMQSLQAELDGLHAQLAAGVTRVAVQLARQVLRSELSVRPELVATVAAEAVGAVMLSARHIAVQVNPADLPLVAEGAEEALTARGARLAANPSIERGGVLVQSDVGAVDARIAMRWTQAAAALGSDLPFEDDEA